MRKRAVVLLVFASAASCAEDEDYVRIAIRGTDPVLSVSTLDMRVLVTGNNKKTDFTFVSQPKPKTTEDLSAFTVSFGGSSASEIDIRLATRPNTDVDWGADARVSLPGGGRTVPIFLSRGETELIKVAPLDGDSNTIAGYGTQVFAAWPTAEGGKVGLFPVNPDDVQIGRPRELGIEVSKVRITSRPSNDFTSEIYATTWIQESAKPFIFTEFRTLNTDHPLYGPKAIGTIVRASDVHVACARRELTPPIATASLVDDKVLVHTHDDFGVTTAGPFESPALERVNRVVGIAVTPNDTVTLAVNGNGSRLVQLDTKIGATVHTETINGQAVGMTLSGDGNRLFVASVTGASPDAKLQVESFSVLKPTRTGGGPSVVASFPFIPGVAAAKIAIASCAIAWPELRRDGSNLTDVYFQELDTDGRVRGEPHLGNVSTKDHHYAPSLVCLSPTRAFLTMFTAPTTNSASAVFAFRRLPTSQQ